MTSNLKTRSKGQFIQANTKPSRKGSYCSYCTLNIYDTLKDGTSQSRKNILRVPIKGMGTEC